MIDHASTEEILRETGVAFTSLRNGFYTSTISMLLGDAVQTGELIAPEDGPVSWTTHADLAEVTAIALSEEGVLDGVTPALTASEAIDLDGVAAIASELAGRPIRRIIVPDPQYLAGLIAHGIPRERAEITLNIFRASRRGEFNRVDPTLAHLIGRPPVSVRDVLKEIIQPASS